MAMVAYGIAPDPNRCKRRASCEPWGRVRLVSKRSRVGSIPSDRRLIVPSLPPTVSARWPMGEAAPGECGPFVEVAAIMIVGCRPHAVRIRPFSRWSCREPNRL
jgi:hypothetical protein